MEEGTIAKMINDFMSINEGELSLNKGDIVQVIRLQDMHWCYGCSSGKEGLIPTNYLMELEVPVLEENQELFASIADFIAQEHGDLSFAKGEIIIGLSPEDDNWWRGKIGERIGVFPTTFVWKLNSAKFKKSSDVAPMSLKARVKTSMKAQLDEEMDLFEGDIITITGTVDKMWYRGICGDRKGIFPKDFVTILNEEEGNSSEEFPMHSSPDPNFLTFHTSVSELADFTSHPSIEVSSTENPQGSLITFSPEEHKNFPSTSYSTNGCSYLNEELSSLFSPKDQNDIKYGINYSNHTENLGISPYGITLYPFYGQFDNELSFQEGEIIKLIRHIDDDWIEGEIEGKKGILPVSYINILIDCDYPTSGNNKSNTNRNNVYNNFRQNMNAKVMHNYAEMNGDISVKEGEEVFIMDIVNQDWCRVRNSAGDIGLCPLSYLSPALPTEELNTVNLQQDICSVGGLPSYSDIFFDQNYSVNAEKPQKDNENISQFSQAPLRVRPESVDDLIAKNIASLNFNLKTPHKFSGSGESKRDTHKNPDEGLGLESKIAPAIHSGAVSEKTVKDGPKSVSGRMSLPASVGSTVPFPERDPPSLQERSMSCDENKGLNSDILISDTCRFDKRTSDILTDHVILRRQGSDRVPHRPAPPVPVAGQAPVRRNLQRNNMSSDPKSSEERKDGFESNQEDHQVVIKQSSVEERRLKDIEQRQNVISELAITEKEYVRDLKLTYETFHLYNEEFLESRGIDVKCIFGNIIEVMHVAENLLDKILFAMKNKSDDEQLVGPCFLELADEMKTVYSSYCMNHDTALVLLEKYEGNENIQRIFNKGIETLKYQVACFDLGSVLIKPVQRILKYPLILNELIKCTDDTHKDKPFLLDAVRKMTEVASHINEFKRRKDLVSKYLDDGNATLSNRMSKLSIHSVLKKSSRLGMKLSSSLGIGTSAKDPEFDVHELLFRSLEKSIKTFLRNVELFYSSLEEVIDCQCICGEILSNCFKESTYNGVSEFRSTQNIILTKYLSEFKTVISDRVLKPLNTLTDLFEGPDKLILKRNDKLLDYNRSLAKSEKNRESRLAHDEVLLSKNNYDALNSQLLEELPKFTLISYEIFLECIAEFISARKLFSGRATKQYLSLCENALMLSKGNVLEAFLVKNNLVNNQIGRFSFVTKKFSSEPEEKAGENKSPILGNKQNFGTEQVAQCGSQRAYLQSHYPPEKLFVVKKSFVPVDTLDLTVDSGNMVALIKNQDPMGNNKRWFVDSGGPKGFVPSTILEPFYCVAPSNSEDRNRPRESEISRRLTNRASLPGNTSTKWSLASRRTESMSESKQTPPPPAYEEVVDSDTRDSRKSPQSQPNANTSIAHRYEEPYEERSFNSHLYAEIPDETSSEMNQSHLYAEIHDETSTEINEFYYALYDFGGSEPHTLYITSGQVLKVRSFQDHQGNPEWWLVEDRNGKLGYVPGNYLKKYN